MNHPNVIQNSNTFIAREYSGDCIDLPQLIPVETITRIVVPTKGEKVMRLTVPCHVCGRECDMESISIIAGRNLCGFHLVTERLKQFFHF